MSGKLTLADHAREMAVAKSDLNALYAVIAVLEGGTVSRHVQGEAGRIIRACKTGAGRALERYDRHLDAIKNGWVQ